MMKKRQGNTYSLIVDNETIAFNTNLSAFYKEIKKIDGNIKSYGWFMLEFKKQEPKEVSGGVSKSFKLKLKGMEHTFQNIDFTPDS